MIEIGFFNQEKSISYLAQLEVKLARNMRFFVVVVVVVRKEKNIISEQF